MSKSPKGYQVIADNVLISEFVATKEEAYALASGAYVINLVAIY